MVFGWRGTGKTSFAMSIADAVSRGEPFGPWAVKRSLPVLYVDAEMPAGDTRERLQQFSPGRSRQQPFYLYSSDYANSLGLPRANLLNQRWREAMQTFLVEQEIKLWFLDNLSTLSPNVDENSAKEWSPINQWLLQLRFAGISTVLLHHVSKGGLQRGTSAREDNLDCSIQLRQPSNYVPEDGCRFIASFTKSRVRTSELSLIADTQFQITEDERGRLTWTWGSVRKETKREILRLMDEGYSQKDVAELVKVDKGYVSRTRKQAVSEGLLTTQNKLSQSGFRYVHGDQE
jgi:hypothetical protein